MMLANRFQVLINRVRRALIPHFIGRLLLSRPDFHKLVQFGLQKAPPLLNVFNQAVRFVLRQDANAAHARIDAVRQRKVDNSEFSAERNGGLCLRSRQVFQTRPFAARQHQSQRFLACQIQIDFVHTQAPKK